MAITNRAVNIRQVYAHNLEAEFGLIDSLMPYFRYISIDTEFPGTVIESDKPYYLRSAQDIYRSMAKNVNATKMIQLGFTLCDDEGRLPKIRSDLESIWQFNFKFDVDSDTSNYQSIEFLKNHGIEFEKHKTDGIDPKEFAALFLDSELGLSVKSFYNFLEGKDTPCYRTNPNPLTWITFQGLCDVGYLAKILSKECLSENRVVFSALLRVYFGIFLFDVKEIIDSMGLRGGLDKVANQLGVTRTSGQSHHAGSDSVLTLDVFLKLRRDYFPGQQIGRFNYKIKELEEDESDVMELMMTIRMIFSKRTVTFCRLSVAYPVQFYHPHPTMLRQPYPISFRQPYPIILPRDIL